MQGWMCSPRLPPQLELPVEGLHDLDHRVAHKDDRSGLDDIRLAALQHGDACALQARDLISGSSIMKKDFRYFCPVIRFTSSAPRRTRTMPTRYMVADTHHASAKNAPAKRAITGDLRAAGHERGQHGRCAALPLIADRTGRHNARDGTAGADDHGDHGFSGKPHPLEDRIQHDRRPCHISQLPEGRSGST